MMFKKTLPIFIIIVLPVIFALSLPLFFRFNLFQDPEQTLSIIAMTILPFCEGLLVIGLSSIQKIYKYSYRFFIPWLSILLFFLVAFVFHLEECACWMIGLPVFLLLSSLGGVTAGYFRLKGARRDAAHQENRE